MGVFLHVETGSHGISFHNFISDDWNRIQEIYAINTVVKKESSYDRFILNLDD